MFCSVLDNSVCEDKKEEIGETVDQEIDEEPVQEEEVYQFEKIKTGIDVAHETLCNQYPHEDFSELHYANLTLHRWLTSEVYKMEFYLMENQWGKRICRISDHQKIRMRRGVHVRNSVKHAVYHLNCVDSDNPVYKSCGFAKGLLTVEAKDRGEFVRMITEAPQLFFCFLPRS